uniref:DNA mismatch repair proteins mutS family domain-containing protein n=1 Tax=viral metagenome TaxID=1070528 RepID=A0A6C0LF07_9ZZZZ
MALVKDYLEKTKSYQKQYGEKTLVLMQVGAFFEVYGLQNKETQQITGSSIVEFSRICDMAIADKKICVGEKGVLMAGFGTYMIDKYIKKLQEAGFTAVVFTQDEQNKNTTRSLSGIYSPGTYFSNDMASMSNNTCCIWIEVIKNRVHVGVSNINIYTGKSAIFEFHEAFLMNPTTFDELERFISIYQPSETIIIANISLSDINDIVDFVNIQSSAIHKISTIENTDDKHVKYAMNCEKQTYQKELLLRFFKNMYDTNTFYQTFCQNAIACQAYCFLLDFIYQHNPNLTDKISEPVFENCSNRLILANHSLKQLNIIDDGQGFNKYSSVEKMLNRCISPMGKREFSHQFLNPTTDTKFLQAEYNITEHILTNVTKCEDMKNKMQHVKDISKLNRNIIMKKISPKALTQLYNNMFIVRDFTDLLKDDSIFIEYLSNKVQRYSNIISDTNHFIQFFETKFCLDLAQDIDITQQFDINFIQRGVNSILDEKTKLYMESMDKLEAIRNYFHSCIVKYEKAGKAGKKSDQSEFVKLHETEKNNFKLMATKRRCAILKQTCQNNSNIELEYTSSYDGTTKIFTLSIESLVFLSQTASNETISTGQINELCKNITVIKIQMKDLLTEVYMKILEELSDFQSQFDTIIQFLTSLDICFAKATIAKKYNYCKPMIDDSACEKSFVEITGLRHCLIEHIQQNEIYVTNDITLGKDDSDGILLYGTNAVGKTSLIRALGIAVIMAQSGLYVPCSQFRFSPYKYIFTRIIGNDNIFKGLSTFAVEMSELRTILRLADPGSLVLGDELCSGTESISAQSIFVAGIKQLFQKESSFIFATHLHEIIRYDEFDEMNTVHLKHMSVFYDREKDQLIYDRKLKDGPGHNMYGLEVCRSLNLPQDFLELANSIRMKYHPESASILSLKTSHYNSKKIVGKCELCKKDMGTEVHHLQHQQIANEDGFINTQQSSFHKNHPGNLITVCEKCHHAFHCNKDKLSKVKRKVKTAKGIQITELL